MSVRRNWKENYFRRKLGLRNSAIFLKTQGKPLQNKTKSLSQGNCSIVKKLQRKTPEKQTYPTEFPYCLEKATRTISKLLKFERFVLLPRNCNNNLSKQKHLRVKLSRQNCSIVQKIKRQPEEIAKKTSTM